MSLVGPVDLTANSSLGTKSVVIARAKAAIDLRVTQKIINLLRALELDLKSL